MRVLSRDIGDYEGKEIELIGWVDVRRDHGKLIFIDLRDRSGVAQVVFLPGDKELQKKADMIRPEWVVRVRGKVGRRPKGMENPKIPSGMYEIAASELEVLNSANTLPIDVSGDGMEIGEDVRMKYRYLDLRRPRLQKNLKMRANVFRFIREFLAERDFVEVETPILGKSTPEGARDYLVPARLHPGKFYALPQSPQQYKQLLMVAGFERYFQIARCFRDEDTRGDRQPEFTQLDIEMSFVNQDDILTLIEELFIALIEKFYPEKNISKKPFPRLNYEEVMKQYNSDKPDLRKDKNDPNELAFAFIVNFPMFEWKETEKRWDAVHHPFTMPKVEDEKDFREKFKKDPSKIMAYQYDLVLNGYEIGGGSIRIHNPALLQAVFEVMGNKPEDVKEKFGHMLEAFQYGVPPHGGIASGLDRVMAILQNEPNIREVIAFPKTGDGRDLMMGAPSEVEKEQLKELNIKIGNDGNRK
jgi:aspartyl-tRNA synthetase